MFLTEISLNIIYGSNFIFKKQHSETVTVWFEITKTLIAVLNNVVLFIIIFGTRSFPI